MADGTEYLDLVMGSGPLVVGHAHPRVVAAITEQAKDGTQYYAANRPAIELAEKIITAVPCAERVKFTSSGAEATFQALRLARAYTGRDVIVRFRGGYHGHHDYGMLGATAGVPATLTASVITAEFNDATGIEEVFAEHGPSIAAVILEPIQRSTPPAPGFLNTVVETARRYGAIAIFDEVVTGFRVAWGGAQELYGVTPDLATYGKVIGGGLPLAAVAGRAEILDLANPRVASTDARYVYFSGTLNGNPLASAAGLATLQVLEEAGSYPHLKTIGDRLSSSLTELSDEFGAEITVTSQGPMVGIACAVGDPFAPDTFLRADKVRLKDIEAGLLARRVFSNLAAKLYLSLAHTEDDIDEAIAAFRGYFSNQKED